jgi:hypothetical protein
MNFKFSCCLSTPSFSLRAQRRKTKRVKRGKLHPISSTTHQVRFKMGGANFNFEVRLRGKIIILKIKKIPWESAWKTDSNDIFFKGIPYSFTNPINCIFTLQLVPVENGTAILKLNTLFPWNSRCNHFRENVHYTHRSYHQSLSNFSLTQGTVHYIF